MMKVESDLAIQNQSTLSYEVGANYQFDSILNNFLANQKDEYPDPCKVNAKLRPES